MVLEYVPWYGTRVRTMVRTRVQIYKYNIITLSQKRTIGTMAIPYLVPFGTMVRTRVVRTYVRTNIGTMVMLPLVP